MNLIFTVSSYCHQDQRVCIATAWTATHVVVKDTKLEDHSPLLFVSLREWGLTLEATRTDASNFDQLPLRPEATTAHRGTLVIERDYSGNVRFCGTTEDGRPTALIFTEAEYDVFKKGVEAGQFDSAESTGRQPAH